MKRNKPLQRKAPLKGGGALKRTPLKRVSSKQAKRLREYTVVRREYLTEHPYCEICHAPATDIHHRKGRGIHTADPTWFLAVCRHCHDTRIHGDPRMAREKGWIID